jgi:hypothetical protein
MTQLIEFQKIQGLWYAILPEYIDQGGDFNDCLMVDGAPEMLDKLSNNGESVLLILSETETSDYDCRLSKYDEEDDWGYYLCYFGVVILGGFHVGLCPVNMFAWKGKHPQIIYVKIKN